MVADFVKDHFYAVSVGGAHKFLKVFHCAKLRIHSFVIFHGII